MQIYFKAFIKMLSLVFMIKVQILPHAEFLNTSIINPINKANTLDS